ncbi:MAG: GDYXXLXY domain-containing protein [Verrucomicrobiota bacterium]
MSNKLKPVLFIIVVVFQLAFLGLIIFQQEQLKNNGALIRLKCEPVDPRSLISGDYVILNYEISSFESEEVENLIKGPNDFDRGKPVWVALQKDADSDFWKVSAIANEREHLKREELVLRGRARGGWSSRLNVAYGLEQYFVPQYQGKDIENNMASASVEVAVDDSGQSAVVRLFLEGEEVKFH